MATAGNAIKGLLGSEKYADLTIRCSGEVFKVHCAILCTRSPFLARAVDGQFKEAVLRDIDLSADELSVVRAMIRYLYTDDYEDAPPDLDAAEAEPEDEFSFGVSSQAATLSSVENEAFPLLFNVKMYVIGDKYDIPGLRVLATEKYQTCVDSNWNSSMFSQSAQYLWDNTMETDRPLRNAVATAAHTSLEELLDRGEFGDILKNNASFCFDVLKLNMGRSLEDVVEGAKTVKKKKGKFGRRSTSMWGDTGN